MTMSLMQAMIGSLMQSSMIFLDQDMRFQAFRSEYLLRKGWEVLLTKPKQTRLFGQ